MQKKISPIVHRLVVLLAIGALVPCSPAQTPLKVCPNPVAPCKSKHREFYPYDLSFTLPAKIKVNTDYTSAPFFAVMLKDKIQVAEKEECDGGEFHTRVENERKKIQTLFPDKKVFASYQCPDMGALSYTVYGKPLNDNFIALYAGDTLEKANQTLALAKTKYPKATLKKMQVGYNQIDQ
ncbi:MAG: hypothetical protein HY231_03005 [Acidobacteria bacterium]|nr:hypothetical protein [Acidobacteriota bacterium]